jgi:8-oxo-dGTP diphosphatase
VPPGVPAVAGVDPGLLRESERVAIDGSAGTLEIDGVREVRVVTAFLQRPDGRILLLRRSEQVGSFQGHWAAVSGYLEDPSPAAQVLREVREETGVSDPKLTLVGPGDPVLSRDGNRVYVVHPFRVDVPSDEVRLNWEHTEFEWVDAAEMGRRPTVPHLQRAWERVRALPRPKP